MPKKEKSLAKVDQTFAIDQVGQMTEMANILKTHIVSQKLYTTIAGKNYVHVDGWAFAGSMLGLFPKVSSVTDLSNDKEIKWRADVELVNIKTGQVMSIGIATCSNKEGKKKNFDEYAVLSMAQTRAIGKAYRNLIGWVMKLAGYESTPSDEMSEEYVKPEPKQEVASKEPVSTIEIAEDPRPEFFCANHVEVEITKAEAEYSNKHFGKMLCRSCQKELRK